MAASMSKPPQRMASRRHHAAERDDGRLGRAAADVDHHVADGLVDGEPGADGGRHGLLDEVGGRRAGPMGRLLHRPALHRS